MVQEVKSSETVWKSVPEWPEYEVSDAGGLRRATRGTATFAGKVLRPGVNPKTRYPVVALCRNGKAKSFNLHTLVALAFLGPKPFPDAEVAHEDGVRGNCYASNLRWDTHAGNMKDMVRHGTNVGGKKRKKT